MTAGSVGWRLCWTALVCVGFWGEPDSRRVVADPASSVEARMGAWERLALEVRAGRMTVEEVGGLVDDLLMEGTGGREGTRWTAIDGVYVLAASGVEVARWPWLMMALGGELKDTGNVYSALRTLQVAFREDAGLEGRLVRFIDDDEVRASQKVVAYELLTQVARGETGMAVLRRAVETGRPGYARRLILSKVGENGAAREAVFGVLGRMLGGDAEAEGVVWAAGALAEWGAESEVHLPRLRELLAAARSEGARAAYGQAIAFIERQLRTGEAATRPGVR